MQFVEDEKHAIFDCPVYNTCRFKYPGLFNLSENNLRFFKILRSRIYIPV